MKTTSFLSEGYEFTNDKSRLDFEVIFTFISGSYWGNNITRESLLTSIKNSECFGVYYGNDQIGFARVVTDYSRLAYLADVFILEEHRGKGLSKRLMEFMLSFEEFRNAKWMLATADAHGLYSQYGFTPLPEPEKYMVKMPPA